jgi:hypothetical protein
MTQKGLTVLGQIEYVLDILNPVLAGEMLGEKNSTPEEVNVPKSLKYTFLVHTIAALLFALGFSLLNRTPRNPSSEANVTATCSKVTEVHSV